MKEEWKDINGYEGLYQVSNLGRVKRLSRTQVMPVNGAEVVFPEHILKYGMGSKDRKYRQVTVTLSKNAKAKTRIVARLVAEHFVRNYDNLPEVHHLDHDTTNNRSDNLKWVSRKEQFDEHLLLAQSNSKKGSVAHNRLLVKIGGQVYASATEASLSLGLAKDSIASAKYRGRDSVKGMKFEYITE